MVNIQALRHQLAESLHGGAHVIEINIDTSIVTYQKVPKRIKPLDGKLEVVVSFQKPGILLLEKGP